MTFVLQLVRQCQTPWVRMQQQDRRCKCTIVVLRTGNAPGPTSSLSSTRHNARQLVAQQPVNTMGQVDTDSQLPAASGNVVKMSLNLTLMISHGTIC